MRIALNDAPDPMLDSALLPRQLASGDPAALDQLASLYQTRVARLAYRLLGWHGDIDDVVQDVFLSAVTHARHFRGNSTVWTWLTTITLNHCRSRQRRAALWQRFRLRAPAPLLAPAADSASDQNEVVRRVHQAIATLSASDREVIVLRHLENRPSSEIAELLGIKPNTVEVRVHRARQKLKSALVDLANE